MEFDIFGCRVTNGWRPDGSPSKYQLSELPDGFFIEGRDRPKVTAGLRPFIGLFVYYPRDNGEVLRHFGLFEFGEWIKDIATGLLRDWKPPQREKKPSWGVRDWAVKQTSKCICKKVNTQWSRLLAKVNPTVVAAQRAMYAATQKCSDLAGTYQFYEKPFVIKDITNYRAAAIASVYSDVLLREAPAEYMAKRLPEYRAFEQALAARGFNRFAFHLGERQSPSWEDRLEALDHWMDLYSPVRKANGPLRSTLMNLPGGVSPWRLTRLQFVELPRPITKRLELAFVTVLPGEWLLESDKLAIVLDSREDEIKAALGRLSEHLHWPLSHRKTRDIHRLAQFMGDYPDNHNGRLKGWLDKSIRWHRDCRQQEIDRTLQRLGAETKTSLPGAPLPTEPGVRFLRTVGEVCQEGADMEHCVASYAAYAVHGDVYFFHVARDGEAIYVQRGPFRGPTTARLLVRRAFDPALFGANSATISVTRGGEMEQAHGPRNSRNRAVTWGERVLRRWGRQLASCADDIGF